MPTWLLRLLPYGLTVAAVLGAMWWLDYRGYQRAKNDAAFERLVTAGMIQRARRDIESTMATTMSALDQGLHTHIDSIDRIDRTIVQPTVIKELTRETRYTDPAYAVSRELLDALNTGRASSACSARVDGGIVCTLPEPAPDTGSAVGPDHRDGR